MLSTVHQRPRRQHRGRERERRNKKERGKKGQRDGEAKRVHVYVKKMRSIRYYHTFSQ